MAKKNGITISDALIPKDDYPYDIPNNWCWVKLGAISSIISKGTTPKGGKSAYVDEGIDFLRVENINDDGTICHDNMMHVTEETHTGFLKRSILEENDVLVSIAGTLGKTAIVKKDDLPLNTNQAVAFVRLADNGEISRDFIRYAIDTPVIQNMLLAKTKVTAIPNLTLEIISDCLIPLPPLAEQQRIVEQIENLFSKLDEAKEKAQEALDSFEIRRSAVMQKVIDEAVDKSKDCQLKSLSDISEIVSGFAFSSADFSEENSVPCIKITNVGVKEYNDSEYQYLPQDFIDKYERFVVKEGDILISLTRSFINAGLKVCRYNKNENALLNQRVALIRNCDKEYVYYYLQTDKVLQYVKQKSKTTNQPNLSIKDLNALKIPVLTPSEQKTVVRQLDATLGMEDEIKERIAGVVSRIDLMKKSILARAFCGELGTNIVDEESSIELLKQILE